MDKIAVLKDYIKDEFLLNPNAQLDENKDLISSGILDSLGILKLVDYIETTFEVEVSDEEVVLENFHSLSAIENYLQQHSK